MRAGVLVVLAGCDGIFGLVPTTLATPDAPIDAVGCSGVEFAGMTALGFDGFLDPQYSPLELWFDRDNGTGLDLYHATRASTDVAFGPAMIATELNSPARDYDPALTADGLDLVFQSERNDSRGQLWEATRADPTQPFGNLHLINELSTTYIQNGHDLSADGLTIYYVDGNKDLYSVTRATRDMAFGMPSSPLASGVQWPTLSPDLHELFYESAGSVVRAVRADTSGPFDTTVQPIDGGHGDPDMPSDPTILIVDGGGLTLLTRSCP